MKSESVVFQEINELVNLSMSVLAYNQAGFSLLFLLCIYDK